jgi:hypothetical protein
LLNSKTINRVQKDTLGNNFLNDILMMASVELAARKTAIYALSLDSDTIHPTFGSNREVRDREMARLISCDALIDTVLKGRESLANCHDEAVSLLVAGHETEIRLRLEDMIPLDDLYSLAKLCNEGDFFEQLVMYTRKHGSKMQKKLHRLKKIKRGNLENRLAILKQDYIANVCEISTLENLVRTESEVELRERTRDIKTLECLSSESVSPHLLELAKKGDGNCVAPWEGRVCGPCE